MIRTSAVVCAALVIVAGVPGHAGAAQMSAGTWPAATGQLTPGERTCTTKQDKTSGGRTIAKLKVCAFPFIFAPGSESDAVNDYGAIWIQSQVVPRNGFCVKKANTDVTLDADVPVHSTAPRGRTSDRTRRVRVELVVDAQGAAEAADFGRIENTFVMRKGKLSRRNVVDDAGSRLVRLSWRGSTRKKIAFAHGIETSWAAAGDAPTFGFALIYRPARPASC